MSQISVVGIFAAGAAVAGERVVHVRLGLGGVESFQEYLRDGDGDAQPLGVVVRRGAGGQIVDAAQLRQRRRRIAKIVQRLADRVTNGQMDRWLRGEIRVGFPDRVVEKVV